MQKTFLIKLGTSCGGDRLHSSWGEPPFSRWSQGTGSVFGRKGRLPPSQSEMSCRRSTRDQAVASSSKHILMQRRCSGKQHGRKHSGRLWSKIGSNRLLSHCHFPFSLFHLNKLVICPKHRNKWRRLELKGVKTYLRYYEACCSQNWASLTFMFFFLLTGFLVSTS